MVMNFSSFKTAMALTASMAVFFSGSLFGQNAPAEDQASELEALRKQVEFQGQQIEALTREVIRLSRLIEEGKASGPSVQTGNSMPLPRSIPTRDTPKAEPVSAPTGKTHTVQKGDTLIAISKRYGVSVEEIAELNKISDTRLIQIGQVLILPANAAAPAEQ